MIFRLERTNSKHPEFHNLVRRLDAHLSIEDGDKHDFYHQFNSIDNIPYVIVAYMEDSAIACGAMKPFDTNSVEVKRMFTEPSQRGNGLGKAILVELELWAQELGYQDLVLETGRSFDAAIALYKKYGFEVIPNYGQYIGVSSSICFKKSIIK